MQQEIPSDAEMKGKLEEVQKWAGKRINDFSTPTPPWCRFYLMKLNESLCQLLYGWESPIEIGTARLPQSAVRQDAPPPAD